MSRQLFWMLNGSVLEYPNILVNGSSFEFSTLNISSGSIDVDWGDDSSNVYTGNNSSVSHVYAASGEYNIVITGDIESITSAEIITQSSLQGVNYKGLTGLTGVSIYNCDNLATVKLPSACSVGNFIINFCEALTSAINISGWTITGRIDVSENHLVSEINPPTTTLSSRYYTFATSISDMHFDKVSAPILHYRDCGLTVSEQDQCINEIYANRSSYSAMTPTIYYIGNLTPNATPSGTYDGTTDWLGGEPTSPQAKRYDLENNVTGTYNFTFTG